MEKIRNIIHADLITMKGGEKGFILASVFAVHLIVFLVTPLYGCLGMAIPMLIITSTLFKNEMKYHSQKMYSVFPVKRTELVNTRFLFSTLIYLISGIITYILMLISYRVKLYSVLMGENFDIIKCISDSSGGMLSEISLFNLVYFSGFSFGLGFLGLMIRSYFKNPESAGSSISIRTPDKKEIRMVLLAFVLIIFVILLATGVIPAGAIITVISAIFLNLASAADGVIAGVVFSVVGLLMFFYNYICTILEYGDREL